MAMLATRPTAIIATATIGPTLAAIAVASPMSPWRAQSAARSMRPPSSGIAGSRLKTTSIAFDDA